MTTKYFHKIGLNCPVCGSPCYYIGDVKTVKDNKYHLTMHCNNSSCKATFRLLRKKNQDRYFREHQFTEEYTEW